jgi:FkbM family methyltransferase
MKNNPLPFYQALLQRLPFRQREIAKLLSILFGNRIKSVVNRSTIWLDLNEMIQLEMFLGTYEPIQTLWFKQCLGPGDVFIDVGASFGYYTTLAVDLVGPSGTVFAFEPSPVANNILEEAIASSNLKNVLLTKAAVGKEDGEASIFLPTTRHLHSPSMLKSDPGFVPVKVPLIALDNFAPLMNISRVKLVKMDVEGYEPDVLAGMYHLISEGRIDNIICEFNSGWLKRNATTPEYLKKRFFDLGYQIHQETVAQENLVGHHGELFDLQDIWFSMPKSP